VPYWRTSALGTVRFDPMQKSLAALHCRQAYIGQWCGRSGRRTMPAQTDVSHHYTHGSLTDAIRDGLASLGKAPGTVTVDDLAPVDEFHIGGRRHPKTFSTSSGSVQINMFSMLDAALAELRVLLPAGTAAGSRE